MLTLPSPRQQRLWCPSLSGSSCSSSGSDFNADSPPFDEEPPFEVPVPEPTVIKKIRNVRKSNIHKCAVCGDRPTGYHYDVLSCNGCKTFFRRTVINRRRFSCSRGGCCEFTKDFRCACRACRFAKCVKAGMNPKAIQFPTNAEKTMESSDEPDVVEKVDMKSLIPVPVSICHDEEYQQMFALDMIIHREQAVQTLRSAQFPIYPTASLRKVLQQPNLVGRIVFNQNIVDVNQLEIYRNMPIKFWMVADLFLTVEFAKTFKVFQEMRDDDKEKMLAHVAGAIQVASQAYYSVLLSSESLTFPDGINALHHQIVRMKKHRFETYYRDTYCRPVDLMRRLQLTLPEFVVFKTLALFSADYTELSEGAREIVAQKRQRLVTIFRKLLVKEYGPIRGADKLAECLFALSSFMLIAEKRRNYLEVCDLIEKMQLSNLGQGIFLKRFDM